MKLRANKIILFIKIFFSANLIGFSLDASDTASKLAFIRVIRKVKFYTLMIRTLIQLQITNKQTSRLGIVRKIRYCC